MMKTFFRRWIKKFRNRRALVQCGDVYIYLVEEQIKRITAGEGLDSNFEAAGQLVQNALNQIDADYWNI